MVSRGSASFKRQGPQWGQLLFQRGQIKLTLKLNAQWCDAGKSVGHQSQKGHLKNLELQLDTYLFYQQNQESLTCGTIVL